MRRVTHLDGLRALAFVAVFLHHALDLPFLWMGVDLFFVLSGFLITRNLLQLRTTSTTGSALGAFFFRRVLRILPPYFIVLTVIVLLEPIRGAELPWFYLFASNIRDASHGPILWSLDTLWSIAVEEQFYLAWPWLVLLAPRRWLAPAFVVCIVGAVIARIGFSRLGFDAVYHLTPCRMDLLAAGALLAWLEARDATWLTRHRLRLAGLAVAGVALFAALTLAVPTFRTSLDDPLFDTVGFGLSTLTFTGVVGFTIGAADARALRWLAHPVLRYVGKISYVAYLVHVLALTELGAAGLERLPTAVLGFAATILLASASWSGLEAPLQRWRGLVPPRPRAAERTHPL